jgi:tetratricopeptide (TPR) repeat protein
MYPIFLSSLCRELYDLRKKIYEDIGGCNLVYVDEQVKWRDIKQQEDIEAVDELIRRVREANVFICVLGGKRHGSPIKIDLRPSAVSFFEIELFQAALLEKEVYLFVRDDFVPEPRLQRLLEILRFAFPEWFNQQRLTDKQITERIKRLVGKERRKFLLNPFNAIRSPINRLVQALYIARGRNSFNSPLLFLDEEFEARVSSPDQQIIISLQKQITTEQNEEKRLSRLWIALRELMSAPYTNLKDHTLLCQWNEILGKWASAGSWYGLHGDMPLGCLSALNSMVKVRQQIGRLSIKNVTSEQTAYPGGALASAKYSIAKRLFVKADRNTRLNEALNDIQQSLKLSINSDDSGLRAIKGSIFRQLGRVTEAISEYDAVLKIRQKQAVSDASIGEAMSELGLGYLRQWNLPKGLQYCKEGVALMRNGAFAGFLARGLRKLSLAYLVNGKLLKAHDAWHESKKVASKYGAFDQA